MADAVASTGSAQLLLQTGPVVMATCDGAALIWDSAGWEGESISCAANSGLPSRAGGGQQSTKTAVLSQHFLFVCFSVHTALTGDRLQPYLCSRRVTSVMSHHQRLSVCFVVFYFTQKEKQKTLQNFARSSVRFRDSAPVVVVFMFIFSDCRRTLCAKRKRSVGAACSPLLCHTPQPLLTFTGAD